MIAYACQAAAEGDERRAFIFLYQTLERQTLGQNWTQETLMQSWTIVFKPWVTTEEPLPHPLDHLFDVLERLWLAAMNKLEPDDPESL